MSKTALSLPKVWWVYVIETDQGALYTGITTDFARRVRQHKGEIKGGAKFFRGQRPVKLRFKKKFANRSLASQFEAYVKGLTRQQKLILVGERAKEL